MINHDRSDRKVILVTGASSGIGKACAVHLAQADYHVYGTTRKSPDRVAKDLPSSQLNMIQMDVRDDLSVHRGIDSIIKEAGRLDVVVNNAGFGITGPIENTSIDEAKDQFETNFFGLLRVCNTVLPIMRNQGSGYIINISSIGGLIGLPFQGLYSASKFAVEGLTEALYKEVRSFGIRVVLIEPGDFFTAFTANRKKTARAETDPAYKNRFEQTLRIIESDEKNGASPEKVARLLVKIIRYSDPRLRYRVGYLPQKIAVTLKKFLPQKLFDQIIMQHYMPG